MKLRYASLIFMLYCMHALHAGTVETYSITDLFTQEDTNNEIQITGIFAQEELVAMEVVINAQEVAEDTLDAATRTSYRERLDALYAEYKEQRQQQRAARAGQQRLISCITEAIIQKYCAPRSGKD